MSLMLELVVEMLQALELLICFQKGLEQNKILPLKSCVFCWQLSDVGIGKHSLHHQRDRV